MLTLLILYKGKTIFHFSLFFLTSIAALYVAMSVGGSVGWCVHKFQEVFYALQVHVMMMFCVYYAILICLLNIMHYTYHPQ
jgi:hypothetical protein